MSINERRKNTKFGLTAGEWVMIAIAVSGALTSFAVVSDDVKDNKEAIAEIKKNTEKQIGDVEDRLTIQIKQSEIRTREDIRELRDVLINHRQP